MEFYLQLRDGDQKIIEDHIRWFKEKTSQELVDLYNDQVKCGIVGVHGQGLYLVALDRVFKKRFGKSPIILKNNVVGLNGKVYLEGDRFAFLPDKESFKKGLEQIFRMLKLRENEQREKALERMKRRAERMREIYMDELREVKEKEKREQRDNQSH